MESFLDRIEDQLYDHFYNRLSNIEIKGDQLERHVYVGTQGAIKSQPGVKKMVKTCRSFLSQVLRNEERSCPCTCTSRVQLGCFDNDITRNSVGTAMDVRVCMTKDHPSCERQQWRVAVPIGYLEIVDSESRTEEPNLDKWEDWCNRSSIPVITKFRFDDNSKILHIPRKTTLISTAKDKEYVEPPIKEKEKRSKKSVSIGQAPEPNRIAVGTRWRSVDDEMYRWVDTDQDIVKLPKEEAYSGLKKHFEKRWEKFTDDAFKRMPAYTNRLLETVNSAEWQSQSELAREDCKRRGTDVIKTLPYEDLSERQLAFCLDTAYHPQLKRIMYSGSIQPDKGEEPFKFKKRFLPEQPFSYIHHEEGNTAESDEPHWVSSPAACEMQPHSKNSYEAGDENRSTRECVRRKASRQIQKTLDEMYSRHQELPSTLHRYEWNARTRPLREKLTRDVYRSIDEILKPTCNSSQQSETQGTAGLSWFIQDKDWLSGIETPRTVTLRLRPGIDTKLQKVRCEGDIESFYEDDCIFKSTFGDKVEPASYAAYMRYLEDIDGVPLEEED